MCYRTQIGGPITIVRTYVNKERYRWTTYWCSMATRGVGGGRSKSRGLTIQASRRVCEVLVAALAREIM